MFSSSPILFAILLTGAPLRTLEPEAAPPAGSKHAITTSSAGKGKPVTVYGQDYRSLDEYLARLERDGHVGKAWYRQVRPGVYELVTNMRPAPEKRLFTRAELEREFGFAK